MQSENTIEYGNLPEETNKYEEYNDFEDMGLNDNLLRGIYSYGFEYPSKIQSKGIKPILDGRDVVAQSQSGTGKTGTFTIGVLGRVEPKLNKLQSIIIANTRELASQIQYVAEKLGSYIKDLNIGLCIGGTNTKDSIKELLKSHIIIGTPGRINMMIKNGIIKTNYLKILVVDEADELLSKSFLPQLKELVESIPKDAQICLFSATMQGRIGITKNFLVNPVKIIVNKDELTLDGIRQYYISIVEEAWKFDTLCDLYDLISISQSIIYVNNIKKAIWLKEKLEDKNFVVSMIHGEMPLIDRTKVLNDFRLGKIRILIATDLIARGIDVQQVSIVLNYDIPFKREHYIHRIGRSGRFGRKGVAINFTTKRELRTLNDIKQFYSTQIDEMPDPTQIEGFF